MPLAYEELDDSKAKEVDSGWSRLDKIFLIVSVLQLAIILFALLVGLVRGTYEALIGIIALLPVLVNVALIIVAKDSFFDLFDIPKSAHLARGISMLLFGVQIPIIFLTLFKVMPYSYFFAAFAVMLLYDNCVSAFYRFRRIRTVPRNNDA